MLFWPLTPYKVKMLKFKKEIISFLNKVQRSCNIAKQNPIRIMKKRSKHYQLLKNCHQTNNSTVLLLVHLLTNLTIKRSIDTALQYPRLAGTRTLDLQLLSHISSIFIFILKISPKQGRNHINAA
jgi:hypothetical protein